MPVLTFDRESSDFKKIKQVLIKQAETTCKNVFPIEAIRAIINEFTFGFAVMTPRAYTGTLVTRGQGQTLCSFILCKHNPDFPEELHIQLLCNKGAKGDGEMLLKLAEEKAKRMGLSTITLESIGEDKLKNWYLKQGYKVKSEIYWASVGKVKVYNMSKFI